MSDWFKAIDANRLNAGEMKEVLLQGQEILLVRTGEGYYAVANRCPHMGGRLSQGKLTGNIVTCPRHSSQFDVTSGNVIRWLKGKGFMSTLGKALKSPRPVRTYPVKVEGGKVMIQISDEG